MHADRFGARRPTARSWWVIGLSTALLILAVSASYSFAERMGLRSLREVSRHRMDLYVASLQTEMRRCEYLPQVVALNEQVLSLLEEPHDQDLQAGVVRYLQTVSTHAGASAIYLMDVGGLTLASSNVNRSGGSVNVGSAYRPYFQDAVKGLPGRFYGIGTVSREPGFYFATAVKREGRVVGVVTVKVNLEMLDEAWGHEGEKIVVADGNGVIFLSSEPQWKFRTLAHLSEETMGRLAATRQYWHATPLSPLGLRQRTTLRNGSVIAQVSATSPGGSGGGDAGYLLQSVRVQDTDWRLFVMSDVAPVRVAARNSAIVAALAFVLGGTLLLHFQQRRRLVAQVLSASAALECANDELERKVQLRTEALSNANRLLEGQVAERKRAEETLRSTLEDLVHTAKMAVLGQMSAGITHELNQPLAALRTLSGNAIVFLEREQKNEAMSNLHMIVHLTDHMGKITAQLKKFARKSGIELRPVDVSAVVADSMFLLGQSGRTRHIRVDQCIEARDPMALCDSNRLEQVLLNLLSNAVDAVESANEPRILVRVRGDDAWIHIEIHDNGPGVAEEARPHLFEPFFSTKAQGMGLGLGLVISASIVRESGGTLRAVTSDLLGGALFAVQLKTAASEATHERA